MSEWLLSIVGIVLISLLLDIIVPEGEINRYIKGVFAIIAVIVIITPILRLANSNFDISNYFSFEAAVTSQGTEDDVNAILFEEARSSIERDLLDSGVTANVVIISKTQNIYFIDAVAVTVSGGDREKIIAVVKRHLDVDGEKIYVYGAG